MINLTVRPYIEKITIPVAKYLLRIGLTPNKVTIAGTILSILVIIFGIEGGYLTLTAICVGLLVLTDLLDGAMARLQGKTTKFGAVLDATCDRLVDGVLFGMLAWWGIHEKNSYPIFFLAFICLLLSQVISYIKARAEANNIMVTGGLVERAERLIITLVAVGLEGLGVSHAIFCALGILTLGSLITIIQRLKIVYCDPAAREAA